TNQIVNKLIEAQTTLAIAESCTGGYISNMITNISGASKIFNSGIICYSNEAKIQILNVNPKIIEKYGAVSELVAQQLAMNIRILSNSKIGVSTTGIAGPTGATIEKPIGLVYIGFSSEEDTIVEKHQIFADRIRFKELVFEIVLNHLEKLIS
ncbi:MAG: CinA family protein, partial [Candidatus Thorarchaeota archaeon]